MNFFVGNFQRICLHFQNTYFSEHLWITQNVYKVELLIFMKWNFKINFEHKSLPLDMGRNILGKIYVEADQGWNETF